MNEPKANSPHAETNTTRRRFFLDGTLAAASLAWVVMTARTLVEYLRPLTRSVGADSEVVLSDRDRVQPRFAELTPAFLFTSMRENSG